MKKLVITTLAAATVGGAFAAGSICDTIDDGPRGGGCRVYDFKASVKLVDGIRKKVKAGNICDKDGYAYYRIGAKRTLKGIFFECNSCNFTNNAAGTYGEPLLWGGDQAAADGVAPGGHADIAHFYITTSESKYKVLSTTDFDANNQTVGTAFYEFKILNYFGAALKEKATKAGALLDIDFMEYDHLQEYRLWSILCAGFGTQSKGMLKNLSGSVAGAISESRWCGIPTVCFEPCLLHASYTDYQFDANTGDYNGSTPDACLPWSSIVVDTLPSYTTDAVSGTWAMKYNASKSKLTTFNALINKTFGSGVEYITAQKNWVEVLRAQYPLKITKQM